jgi:hypothetical protein
MLDNQVWLSQEAVITRCQKLKLFHYLLLAFVMLSFPLFPLSILRRPATLNLRHCCQTKGPRFDSVTEINPINNTYDCSLISRTFRDPH